MGAVLQAVMGGIKSLVHPIIFRILVVPMLIALALWIGISWAYWDAWRSTLERLVVDQAGARWTLHWDFIKLASWIAAALIMMALAHIIILTSLLIVMVFAMPA
ncbi:MAG: hypothetical protein ABI619_01445, partial [Betaproteobacteria bacterium]